MPIPQRRSAARSRPRDPEARAAPGAGAVPAAPRVRRGWGNYPGTGLAGWRGELAALLLAILLLAALLLIAGRAGAVELKIEAPSFTFDSDRHIYRYQEARISLGDLSIEAQEVLINERNATLQASGQLRVRSGTMYISADRIDLDVESQTGIITNARLYDSATGYYLRAGTMNILPGRIFAARCSLTSCPPLVPGWKLTVGNLDYRVDEFATGTNATLDLGDTPVFWFPIIAWPTVQKRRSGVLPPEISSRAATLDRFNLGTRLTVPYFLDLGPEQDLTFSPEAIERRGPALGIEYRYAFHGDQIGRLRVWGIDEERNREPGQENNILDPGGAENRTHYPFRYTLDYGHNEGIGESGRLLISATRSSDGQVRREYEYIDNYRPETIYQTTVSNQAAWGDVAVSLEHASEFTSESIYADRDAFSNGPNRPQLLPRVSYGKGGRPFDALPLGIEFTSAVTRFVADADVSGNSAVARPAIALPIKLGEAAELRTQFARQFVDYDGMYGKDQNTALAVPVNEGFAQSEGQVELRSTFAGVFNREIGPYSAIKHRVTPRLIYDEVEDVRQPLADRLVRARIAERLMTFRLDNSFIGHLRRAPPSPEAIYESSNVATSGRFDLFKIPLNQMAPVTAPRDYQQAPVEEFAQINLIQRYNFLEENASPSIVGPALPAVQETAPGNPLLPAIAQASYTRGGLGLSYETHYHHQLQRITETIIGMSASLRQFSRLGITYTQNEFSYRTPENKLHPIGNSLGANGEIEVVDATTVGFAGTLDLRDLPAPLGHRLQTSEVFVDFHPICYRIRISVRDSLELTQTNGVDQYFTSRRVLLTFDLGNVLSTTREQAYASGAPR